MSVSRPATEKSRREVEQPVWLVRVERVSPSVARPAVGPPFAQLGDEPDTYDGAPRAEADHRGASVPREV